MVRCAPDGRVIWSNDAATRLLGTTPGGAITQVVDESERELLRTFVAGITEPGSRRVVVETTHIGAVEVLGSAGADGDVTLAIYSLASFRAEVEAERIAARTDALTGLLNRTGFFDLVRELRAAGAAIAVGIVDLDRFKTINDERGHGTGDGALRGVAALLEARLEHGDLVGRLGGDEFGLCFVGDEGMERARRYASAFAADLAAGVPIDDDDAIPMTASIGFATWRHGTQLSSAVAEADVAMYRAKQDGTTGVVEYDVAESGSGRLDRTIDELRERADIDRRTGLRRDHVFERDLPLAVGRARAEGTSLSVLIVDLDRFHIYNEHFLYEGGHRALRAVAATIDATIRADDRSYRYGGEEFAVLLPATDSDTAVAIGDRIRRAVADLGLTHPGTPSGVLTVSVGVATASAGAIVEPQWVVNGANLALLEAKEAGRDVTRLRAPTEQVPPVGIRS